MVLGLGLCGLSPLSHAIVVAPAAHNGVTVWTGSDSSNLDASQIGGIVGVSGLSVLYEAGFGAASVATNAGGNSTELSQRVIFTAVQSGLAGHGITLTLVNPGNSNAPLSVSVNGTAITVSLATNSAGAITSTAAQVTAAVNASPSSSALVTASTGGNAGAGTAGTMATTALTPTVVEGGGFASSYQTTFSNSTSFPQGALIDHLGGTSITGSPLFLYVKGNAQTPAFYIYQLSNLYNWNGTDDLALSGFWSPAGAITNAKILGSNTSTVPDAGHTGLMLVVAVAALGFGRRVLGAV